MLLVDNGALRLFRNVGHLTHVARRSSSASTAVTSTGSFYKHKVGHLVSGCLTFAKTIISTTDIRSLAVISRKCVNTKRKLRNNLQAKLYDVRRL